MTFPEKKFADVAGYADAYFARVTQAAASVDRKRLQQAAAILARIYSEGRHGLLLR